MVSIMLCVVQCKAYCWGRCVLCNMLAIAEAALYFVWIIEQLVNFLRIFINDNCDIMYCKSLYSIFHIWSCGTNQCIIFTCGTVLESLYVCLFMHIAVVDVVLKFAIYISLLCVCRISYSRLIKLILYWTMLDYA